MYSITVASSVCHAFYLFIQDSNVILYSTEFPFFLTPILFLLVLSSNKFPYCLRFQKTEDQIQRLDELGDVIREYSHKANRGTGVSVL